MLLNSMNKIYLQRSSYIWLTGAESLSTIYQRPEINCLDYGYVIFLIWGVR